MPLYNNSTLRRFLLTEEQRFLQAVSELAYSNPFLPEHTQFERAALGRDFVEGEPVWSRPTDDPEKPRVNVWKIFDRLEPLIDRLRERLVAGQTAGDREYALYHDGVLHLLYQRYYSSFFSAGFGPDTAKTERIKWGFFRDFLNEWKHFFHLPGRTEIRENPSHMFACFRQIQRAFEQIFRDIIGNSLPAARLRGAIWQSIFTHDLRRYQRTLYGRMADFVTLVTGPSGTGKELVARAIAQSRYVPFDERTLTFADDRAGSFFPINVSALSPALVESELFGHRRGSFTGAIGDRKGWLETCTALGSVFLDELGDLDPAIQVKLLRVIETRSFHPVGDTASRQFQGKLIAATNRDLEAGIRNGKFREDLYYRLCSDQIATPSLAEQLADSPGVLRELVVYMARRVAGAEAGEFVPEGTEWIEQNLGVAYGWPGNYRELEQCVRNVLIRRDYRPARAAANDPMDRCVEEFRAGSVTADDLLSRYCTLVYAKTNNYEEVARRLQIDRRTVKGKVDAGLLKQLRSSKQPYE